MAFDKKLFACVARATNSIYFYVSGDAWSTIKAENYFTGASGNKNVTGQLKVGDVIIVNSTAASTNGGMAILRITAVDQTAGTITTEIVTLKTS